MSKAQFNIGDVVIHKKHHYRAVVIDVDPIFQASGYYNPQAHKHKFATRNPWYRLLLDNRNQITYVEECMLSNDNTNLPITNSLVSFYLKEQKIRLH